MLDYRRKGSGSTAGVVGVEGAVAQVKPECNEKRRSGKEEQANASNADADTDAVRDCSLLAGIAFD
jgi:hypothetical protein